MTLIQALNRLHALLEGDTNTPTTGDDYNLRIAMLNDAQEEWAGQTDTRWRELFTTDTTQTGDGTTKRFDLPTDFKALNGSVVLYDSVHDAYTQIGTIGVGLSPYYDTHDALTAWIEGSELVFNTAPEDDAVIHIPYYRQPDALENDSDVLPMSDPRYAIYYALARLVEQSGDFTRYNTNMQKAEDLLLQMKVNNETLGEGVANPVPTLGAGFGD